MVNAQEWLDKNHPKEERSEITKLDIGYKNLTGELKISEFSNLTKLVFYNNHLTELDVNSCSILTELVCHNNQLTKLELNECVNLIELSCSLNQLTKLELNECVNLIELSCFGNQLTNLEFNENIKLIKLNCSYNQLTKLELNECVNLIELDCSDNELTNLDFLQKLNPTKLTSLKIENNNFQTSDCSVFSHLVNLKELSIGSDDLWQIESPDIYNRFTGSLKPLKNLTKLRTLDIKNTDLNRGLEYLPDSLTNFHCSAEPRLTVLSQQLINQLIIYGQPKYNHGKDNYAHLLPIWKEVQADKNFKQKFPLLQQLTNSQAEINQLRKLLKNKEHLILLFEYSLINKDDFADTYQLITKIGKNEELVETKEKEIKDSKTNDITTERKKQEEITKLVTENQTLTNQLKHQGFQRLQEQLNLLIEKNKQLESQLVKLQTDYQVQVQKLKEQTVELSFLQTQLTEKDQYDNNLHTELTNKDNLIFSLQSKLQDLNQQENEIELLQNQITQLTQEKETNQTQLIRLKWMDGELEEKEEESQQLEIEVEMLKERLSDWQIYSQDLQTQLENKDQELNQIKNQLSQLQHQQEETITTHYERLVITNDTNRRYSIVSDANTYTTAISTNATIRQITAKRNQKIEQLPTLNEEVKSYAEREISLLGKLGKKENKITSLQEEKKKLEELVRKQNKIEINLWKKKEELIQLKRVITVDKKLEKIDQLCQCQLEIANLETQLDNITKEKDQIIYNISVKQGHAFINSQLGNNANLSQNTNNNVRVGNISIEHSQFAGSVAIGVGEIVDSEPNATNQTKLVEITEKFQTQIEISPK